LPELSTSCGIVDTGTARRSTAFRGKGPSLPLATRSAVAHPSRESYAKARRELGHGALVLRHHAIQLGGAVRSPRSERVHVGARSRGRKALDALVGEGSHEPAHRGSDAIARCAAPCRHSIPRERRFRAFEDTTRFAALRVEPTGLSEHGLLPRSLEVLPELARPGADRIDGIAQNEEEIDVVLRGAVRGGFREGRPHIHLLRVPAGRQDRARQQSYEDGATSHPSSPTSS
jgi:hypothetical protein